MVVNSPRVFDWCRWAQLMRDISLRGIPDSRGLTSPPFRFAGFDSRRTVGIFTHDRAVALNLDGSLCIGHAYMHIARTHRGLRHAGGTASVAHATNTRRQGKGKKAIWVGNSQSPSAAFPPLFG